MKVKVSARQRGSTVLNAQQIIAEELQPGLLLSRKMRKAMLNGCAIGGNLPRKDSEQTQQDASGGELKKLQTNA